MLSEQDKTLISFYRALPKKEATAAEIKDALGYPSVGAVNLHVVRLAKAVAGFLSYSPTIRPNGQKRWWPCLFDGRAEKHGFVWTLRKDVEDWYVGVYPNEDFMAKVLSSSQDAAARQKRLATAPKKAKLKFVQVLDFDRNPDVVAEVLSQASGKCQKCGALAPFFRKSDGSPYLEVHHKIPLAFGGEDTVANAIALCPNCHRKAHYG
jgi:predicted HNH restriction endonuclease